MVDPEVIITIGEETKTTTNISASAKRQQEDIEETFSDNSASIYRGTGLEQKTTLYLATKDHDGPKESVKIKVQATRGEITQL